MSAKSTNKQQLNVTNAKEIKAALLGLSDNIKNKVLRKVVNRVLDPVAKNMKQQLDPHKRTGLLKKSIKKKVKTYSSGITVGFVGPDRETVGTFGKKNPKKAWPFKYAHLVNYGTKAHDQPKRGTKHKGSKPADFLKKAHEATKGTTVNQILTVVEAELNKEVQRLAA